MANCESIHRFNKTVRDKGGLEDCAAFHLPIREHIHEQAMAGGGGGQQEVWSGALRRPQQRDMILAAACHTHGKRAEREAAAMVHHGMDGTPKSA